MHKIKNLFILILWFALSAGLFCGCATIAETGKGLMGTSTRALEEVKDSKGESQSFKISYADCYQRTVDLLRKKKIHLFLHSQRKHRIVAINFINETDTTEVGIFFTETQPQETKVTVVSLSPSRQKMATEIVFQGIMQVPADSSKKEGTK